MPHSIFEIYDYLCRRLFNNMINNAAVKQIKKIKLSLIR